MRRHPRLVGLLWRWHRRLGLVAAMFVLVLAATGIVLNHSSELGLDRSFVDWPWLSRAYGDDSATLPAYHSGEHWLSRAANGRVYLNAREVAPCNGKLVGVVPAGELLYVGCEEELLLISPSGELVESISGSTGLPAPLTAIGLVADSVVLRSAGNWWLADLDQLDFSNQAPGGVIIHQLAPGQLPVAIRQEIPAPDQWLSWERLLLDLHSGRVFGRAGVLWMDAVGVLLGCLAISGFAMWGLHRRSRRRRPQH
jgi:hypothetical protein